MTAEDEERQRNREERLKALAEKRKRQQELSVNVTPAKGNPEANSGISPPKQQSFGKPSPRTKEQLYGGISQ